MRTQITFILLALLIFSACQPEKKNTPDPPGASDKESPKEAPSEPEVLFEFEADPGTHKLTDSELLKIVQNRYANSKLEDDTIFHCSDGFFSGAVVAQQHYYRQYGELYCFAILGNSVLGATCESRYELIPHLSSGHCDALVLQVAKAGWKINDFKTKIGGHGESGDWGSVKAPVMFGPEAVYMELYGSYMNKGSYTERSQYIGVIGGKVFQLADISTLSHNDVMDTEDKEIECKCNQVKFVKGDPNLLSLIKIIQRNCVVNGKVTDNCEGQVLRQTKISASKDHYVIPEEFQLW